MTSEFEAAIKAATDGSTVRKIKDAVETPIESAINDRVELGTQHAIDEALSMPRIGGVARATESLTESTYDAVRSAVAGITASISDQPS